MPPQALRSGLTARIDGTPQHLTLEQHEDITSMVDGVAVVAEMCLVAAEEAAEEEGADIDAYCNLLEGLGLAVLDRPAIKALKQQNGELTDAHVVILVAVFLKHKHVSFQACFNLLARRDNLAEQHAAVFRVARDMVMAAVAKLPRAKELVEVDALVDRDMLPAKCETLGKGEACTVTMTGLCTATRCSIHEVEMPPRSVPVKIKNAHAYDFAAFQLAERTGDAAAQALTLPPHCSFTVSWVISADGQREYTFTERLIMAPFSTGRARSLARRMRTPPPASATGRARPRAGHPNNRSSLPARSSTGARLQATVPPRNARRSGASCLGLMQALPQPIASLQPRCGLIKSPTLVMMRSRSGASCLGLDVKKVEKKAEEAHAFAMQAAASPE